MIAGMARRDAVMHAILTRLRRLRSSSLLLISLAASVLSASLTAGAQGAIHFDVVDREIVLQRLNDFASKNRERERRLKDLFLTVGCKEANLSEQRVRGLSEANVVCVFPGKTDDVIIVGAHFDHVHVGDGVVDNWSGASLLPSLFVSLKGQTREHTYIFVGFAGEEQGMVGSESYVNSIDTERLPKIEAMVNLDTLGLGPTKVWASHADKRLLGALISVAQTMKLPLQGINVDGAGSTDSESFAHRKIPSITVHSVTQQTWTILHSSKDKIDAISTDDYYATYRLLAAYLAFLDGFLKPVSNGDPVTQQRKTDPK
jgi:peptidase M28-like protein